MALSVAGEIRQRYELATRRHGQLILPWAEALLAESGIARSQLDAIALSRGPGSFTSLRLGISAGLAMAFALDRPVYAISSLAALAQTALNHHADESTGMAISHIYALMDARMGEVYLAQYRRAGARLVLLGEERLLTPQACPAPDEAGDWIGAGNGFELLPADSIQADLRHINPQLWPTARAMLELLPQHEPTAAEAFSPVYLRDRVAEPPAQRAHAR